MLTINKDFFNLNNEEECVVEEINEKIFILDMIKLIRLENIKEIKDNNKQYNILFKPFKDSLEQLMLNSIYEDKNKNNKIIETDISKYIIENNKIKIF